MLCGFRLISIVDDLTGATIFEEKSQMAESERPFNPGAYAPES